jgi:hypothetical protein
VPQLEIPDNRTMPSTLTVLNALDPGGSPMQPRRSLKWIAAFAISLAMASWLAPAAQAGPTFDLELVPPGPARIDIGNSPAPLIQAITGTDGMFGSGSAFGRAQLGNLGAKTTCVETGPVGHLTGSFADAEFHDVFPLFFAGPLGFVSVRFTVSLDGTTSVSGNGQASVGLDFNALSTAAGPRSVILDGPGTTTLEIPVFVGNADSLQLDVFLQVSSGSDGPGSAIADFSQSFKIDAVQLFDGHGNFIQDLTLVDGAGNVLPVSPATVPEPGSALLLAIATGVLGAIGLRSRRRIEAERRL